MTSARAIDAFVALPAIAIVGVSRTGRGFGNIAMRELRAHGYRVHPIHPLADDITTEKFYRHFSELPERVDGVLVVVPPEQVVDVMIEAAAAGIHRVWLQQGAESPEAVARGRALGLEVVAGECILMFAKPAGIHKAHRWICGVLGKLPQREGGAHKQV